MNHPNSGRLRLTVLADPDPGVLFRILDRFIIRNVVPIRVLAVLEDSGLLNIEIELRDFDPASLTLIAARLAELPCVHHARGD